MGEFYGNPWTLLWLEVAVLASAIGVLAGLIGLVSRTFRGYRAPVAGAIVVICGVVIIISMVGIGIEIGDFGGPWPLFGGLGIVIGLCMAFIGNRPPDRQPLRSLPGMCNGTTPQGRPCCLPPGHEGSHRYVTSTRHHPPLKERATSPRS